MTYMKLSAILGATLAVAGCETTVDAMKRQQGKWIGQPVEAFAEQHSLAPERVYRDTYGQQTYIFRKPFGYSSCGVTIKAMPEPIGGDVIAEMTSTCPPGAL